MRTTLTLDPDVVQAVDRVQQEDGSSFKQAVNTLIRMGVAARARAPERNAPVSTDPVDLGPCLIGSLDDIAEALALAEGERFRS